MDSTRKQTLAEQHKAFKEQAVLRLHEYAAAAGHCYTFDQALVDIAGLPGREGFHRDYDVKAPEIVGERTTKAFEAWRDRVTREAWKRADEYGLGHDFDRAMEDAGFAARPPKVTRDIVVKGSFEIPMTVTMREGDAIVDSISLFDLGSKVRAAVRHNTGEATWKATVA